MSWLGILKNFYPCETNGENFKNNYFIESLIKSKNNGESIYGSTAISLLIFLSPLIKVLVK